MSDTPGTEEQAAQAPQETEAPKPSPLAGMHPVAPKEPTVPSQAQVEEVPTVGPAGPANTGTGAQAEYDAAFDFLQQVNWESVPDQDQINAWKKEHGGVIIVSYPYGMVFFHRLLTRAEYKGIVYQPLDFEQRENLLCQTTLLWPFQVVSGDKVDFGKHFKGRWQGVPSTLVEYVLDRSGFINALEVGNA